MNVTVVVEGTSDEETALRVVEYAGLEPFGRPISVGGTARLDSLIPNYVRASVGMPFVVFRDSDGQCPVELVSKLSAKYHPCPTFVLRIAHTMTEAWLLANRED